MKNTMMLYLIAAALAAGCVVAPGPGRHDVGVVPFLPPVVVLGEEPYYHHKGYYYHYSDDHWYYSRSRNGPWSDLPRNHYPREVRHEGRERREHHYRDRDRDRD